MSYFSSKSTWLSLVDNADRGDYMPGFLPGTSIRALDGVLSFEDYRPCFAPSEPDRDGKPADKGGGNGDRTGKLNDNRYDDHDSNRGDEHRPADTAEDLDYLRVTQELRHRLFFQFKEWEFGPGLYEDHLRLARAQREPEEALAHYCRARHVAVTLVDKFDQPEYRLAWIETNRVIAEIHALIGNDESCAVYAREGLKAIKKGKFASTLDMRITKLTVRFLDLLGGK